MRALCGSVIAAGAMIGLGLTALGYGIRYQGSGIIDNPHTNSPWGAPTMAVIMVVLVAGVLIGIATAFIGLAYHHERRYRERLHHESLGTSRSAI